MKIGSARMIVAVLGAMAAVAGAVLAVIEIKGSRRG